MKTKRGGIRPNSGRKKLSDKKEPVTIYVRPSKAKTIGRGGETDAEILLDVKEKLQRRAL